MIEEVGYVENYFDWDIILNTISLIVTMFTLASVTVLIIKELK